MDRRERARLIRKIAKEHPEVEDVSVKTKRWTLGEGVWVRVIIKDKDSLQDFIAQREHCQKVRWELEKATEHLGKNIYFLVYFKSEIKEN